ncbi:sugar phosphate nucleotidyltransferase [Methyloterricola oryzae]|uniref:sugar phosphate nucleotidyltransferase n=1 Tax=Methyloterricola oryzae TaxID=1495050 RepID=UPI0005EB5BA6|nr:sugar phosphate nucleotidyltransferase [Methyloterricola oryzae]
MHAVILAGGKGTRLRPYTTVLPKPLMPISDMPIIEVVLRQLKSAGVEKVTLAVAYLAELLEAFCLDGSRFGLDISYSREAKELSTAGPLKLIDGLDDTFLVMNGDLLTTLDYRKLRDFHKSENAAATIAVHRRTVKIDFGVVKTNGHHLLDSYIEKPEFDYRVSMGINVLEPRALKYIEYEEALGMPDLMLRLKDAGEKVCTYEEPCTWYDIGRIEDYDLAVDGFCKKRSDFLHCNGG